MKLIAHWIVPLIALSLAGCTIGRPPREATTLDQINAELKDATQGRAATPVAPAPAPERAVVQSLLPPLTAQMPRAEASDLAQRFDLTVTNASAPQVLNAIVSGTSYSMVVHPAIKEPISLNLKNVTIPEVLNSVRELYGYDYRIEGTLIYVTPAMLQTRMFRVDYLTSLRRGSSDVRVSNNTVGQIQGPAGGAAQQGQQGQQAQQGASPGAVPGQSSHIETTAANDFWRETFATLAVLTGCTSARESVTGPAPATVNLRDIWGCDGPAGRRLVVSPQSGSVLVRAMPEELNSVATYLRASQASVERQVLIEAKILEVALRDGYEAGVNWSAFMSRASQTTGLGMLGPGVTLGTTGSGNPLANLGAGLAAGNILPSGAVVPLHHPAGRNLSTDENNTGSLFTIAFQGSNFAALMSFLDSQGVVHTLSSPRISTLNNQKAVLKVGSDSLFVTRITGGSVQQQAAGLAPTVTAPTFEVQSFFSGIALDVTPRIGDDGTITLHIRPAVTDVTQQSSTFNLGFLGTFTIPLVSNAVSETDTVIRALDGQIIALGGLMRQVQRETRNQVPGVGELPFLGAAFRNTNQNSEKRELVILLRPRIVHNEETWARNILDARERMRGMDRGFSYGGRSEVLGTEGERWVPPPPN
jgi:MSHA biogenesis protein MshL